MILSAALGSDAGGDGGAVLGFRVRKEEETEAGMSRGVECSESSLRLGCKFGRPEEPFGMLLLDPLPAPEVERVLAKVSRLLERRVPRLLKTPPMCCLRGLLSGRKDEGNEAA